MRAVLRSRRGFGIVAWLAAGAVLGGSATLASPGATLPESVAKQLRRQGIPLEHVSVHVQAVGGREPILALNEQVPRNPASVIKLLTSFAALEMLGPGYSWRTEAYTRGRLRDGNLEGDLLLKGYGDPYMVPETFWRFLRGLRERGIAEIRGDLVLDDTFFSVPQRSRSEFDGRPHRAYNALPHALNVNFQATRLHLVAEGKAGGVRVFADPPLSNLTIRNQLKLVSGPCRAEHRRPQLRIHETASAATVKLHGTYSTRCPETSIARLFLHPLNHVGGAFSALWTEMGGRLNGVVRAGEVPDNADLLHVMPSRPLAEVIRGMNKHSNNLMSRLLLLTLGAETYGEPGTVEKGRLAVRSLLRAQRLVFPELVLDNGAGLSREARISAQSVGRLLHAAFASRHMPEFVASLAVAGIDGTMRMRFQDRGLAGHAHIKTGSLDGVSTMAGYVLDRQGQRWAVAMLINHPGLAAWRGKLVQNALLQWVFEGQQGASQRYAQGLEGSCKASITSDALAAETDPPPRPKKPPTDSTASES